MMYQNHNIKVLFQIRLQKDDKHCTYFISYCKAFLGIERMQKYTCWFSIWFERGLRLLICVF